MAMVELSYMFHSYSTSGKTPEFHAFIKLCLSSIEAGDVKKTPRGCPSLVPCELRCLFLLFCLSEFFL